MSFQAAAKQSIVAANLNLEFETASRKKNPYVASLVFITSGTIHMKHVRGGGEQAWSPFKAQYKTTLWTLYRGWKCNGWWTFFNLPTSRVLHVEGRLEARTMDSHMAVQEKRTWHVSKCKCSEDAGAKAKNGKGQGKRFCFSLFEHSKDLL